MDSIHFREDIIVGRHKATLIFFDKHNEASYDYEYVTMVQSAPILTRDNYVNIWVIEDTLGNVYRIKQNSVDINQRSNSASIKKDKVENLFFKADFKNFLLNNHLPEDSEIDEKFAIKHLYTLKISQKYINRPLINWDITKLLNNYFSVIMIINGEIIGKVNCDIIDQMEVIDYFESNDVMYTNMNLYIANVDIRSDFHGNRLCTPLVTYMIKHLKRLGYEMLFISNASRTGGGVPACICYYKAGINNNYKMRYKQPSSLGSLRSRLEALESSVFRETTGSGALGGRVTKLEETLLGKKKSGAISVRLGVLERAIEPQESTNYSIFKNMNLSDCTSELIPKEYYYISDSIGKRGKKKLQSAVRKIKVLNLGSYKDN
jgi:hypothetical protein